MHGQQYIKKFSEFFQI